MHAARRQEPVSDPAALGFAVARMLSGDNAPVRFDNGTRDSLLFVVTAKDECYALLDLDGYRTSRCPEESRLERILRQDKRRWKINIESATPHVYCGCVYVTAGLIANIKRAYAEDRPAGEVSGNSNAHQDFDSIIKAAFGMAASDIHFLRRGEHEQSVILMRRKGIIVRHAMVSRAHLFDVIRSAYNTLSSDSGPHTNFDHKIYQDCDIVRLINGRSLTLRYAHYPIAPKHQNALHAVIRLTMNDEDQVGKSLTEYGYLPGQASLLEILFKHPSGMIVFVGKVNSGKSTTMRRMVQALIHRTNYQKIVMTIEDPVEGRIDGAIQSPAVTDPREERFRVAVKSTTRRDMDVLMLGEVRDGETLKSCIKLANSGALVVTSLHANHALGAIPRLEELGWDLEFPIDRRTLCTPNVIVGLVYQKLLPVLCSNCAVPLADAIKHKLIDGALTERIERVAESREDDIHVRKQDGCDHCDHDGIIGRTVCAEIVPIDPKLRTFLRAGDDESAIDYVRGLKQGNLMKNPIGTNALDVAIHKMREGIFCPRDVESELGPLTHDLVVQDGSITNQELMSLLGHDENLK